VPGLRERPAPEHEHCEQRLIRHHCIGSPLVLNGADFC
jgi:hypothetical protein